MKYSFMSFSCPGLDIDEMISVARRFGYDGIELRISSKHKHGAETDADTEKRLAIKRAIDKSDIDLCCIATSCKYADPAATDEQVRETLRSIDLASDLGAPTIRVFGGAIPEGITREKAIDLVAGALRSAAGHAEQKGVTVCIETHDDWCDPAHIAEVLKKADSAAIAANWDIMHPVRRAGATIDSAFAMLKPWIGHIHFHDGVTENGKPVLKPIGQGQIDHRRAVELLKSINYDGFLSGEWSNWEPYETHLPRELATMKRYEQET